MDLDEQVATIRGADTIFMTGHFCTGKSTFAVELKKILKRPLIHLDEKRSLVDDVYHRGLHKTRQQILKEKQCIFEGCVRNQLMSYLTLADCVIWGDSTAEKSIHMYQERAKGGIIPIGYKTPMDYSIDFMQKLAEQMPAIKEKIIKHCQDYNIPFFEICNFRGWDILLDATRTAINKHKEKKIKKLKQFVHNCFQYTAIKNIWDW